MTRCESAAWESSVTPGAVYWITGLPGAGRRTLARALAARLIASGRAVVRLDGHGVRQMFAGRFGYGSADRRTLAAAYGQLCRQLSDQGLDVVFATASLIHDAQAWNRTHIARYREVSLLASPETIARRHPKGLVAAARAGRLRNVPGIDIAAEAPLRAEVVIEDDGLRSADAIAAEVLDRLALHLPAGRSAAPAHLA